MKTFEVILLPLAEDDLASLYDWIADDAGPDIAHRFVLRIQKNCRSLTHFPERGTLQKHLGSGIRTFGLDRRVTIAFRVEGSTVTVLRILYGGRDLEDALTKS